jgi:peptide chain release factor subunit 1
LAELLESDEKFGFIIMDGNGTLFGTLSGNTRAVLHKFSVDLPKKHGRGGQSALRFARLRLEKRHNYIRKVAELATQLYIENDKPNVSGLILAGSAEFKVKLSGSDLFDPRLAAIVTKIVDVSYGGENGFNQAIELAADALSSVKFIKEKKLLSAYFSHISRDTGLYCFGVKDTLFALDLGACEDIIVYENLNIQRYEFRNPQTDTTLERYLNPQQEQKIENFKDKDGTDLDIVNKMPLLEWLANHFNDFGAKLNFVTNRSQEGSQFVRGFGGIGGILRYKVSFEDNLSEDEEWDDDGDFI